MTIQAITCLVPTQPPFSNLGTFIAQYTADDGSTLSPNSSQFWIPPNSEEQYAMLNNNRSLACSPSIFSNPRYKTNLFLAGLTIVLASLWTPSPAIALSTSPTSLTFSGTQGGNNPASQIVTLWKGGDRTRNWTIDTSAPWATVTPSSGSLASERDQVTVSVNLSGLGSGTYTSTLNINLESLKGRWSKTAIPITLTISGSGSTPSIRLSPITLGFSGVAGGANPAAQLLSLSNPTGGTLSWSLSDSAAWLGLSTASGTTTTETDAISVSVNLTGLAAGTYSAVINIAASGATNTPQAIPVSLTVAAAPSSTPIIGISLTSLSFAGTAGGTNPATQSFTISNTGSGTLTWTAGDNATWLTLSPATGTNTGTVTATINLTGLAVGTYSGTVTVAATGATSKTLPVALTVGQGSTTTTAATLSWGANTDTDLAGYKVYVGTQSGVYGAPITLGHVTTYQIINLTVGTTYFFSVTAYDTAGNESPHSGEVSKSIF